METNDVKNAIDTFSGKIDAHLKDMVLEVMDRDRNCSIFDVVETIKTRLMLDLSDCLALELSETSEEYETLRQLFLEDL
jgi:hypothetical protein